MPMIELIEYSFFAINIIPTGLLLLTIMYWFFVMLGALDLGFLDFDLEPDGESDIDIAVEVGTAPEGVTPPFYISVLGFFNIGKIPIMVFITLLAIPMWFFAVIGNYYLGISNIVLALLYLIPNFFLSLFIAKFVSTPFVYLFQKMTENDGDNFSAVGKKCKVKHEISANSFGQAIVIGTAGEEHIISAKTFEGKTLKKGEMGLVIEYVATNHTYIVDSYKEI